MDFSKQYIEMCEKATEIQKLGFTGDPKSSTSNLEHSFYVCGDCYELLPEDSGVYYKYASCDKHYKDDIWLPRQDQLQDMIEENFLVIKDDKGIHIDCKNHRIWGDSFEQAFLNLIMKEKYNKVWDCRSGVTINTETGETQILQESTWDWYYD